METAVLLGFLQGISEWLPISSEGVVSTAYGFIHEASLGEAVSYALWLHLGTVPPVLIVFRREVLELLRELVTQPLRPSPLARYMLLSTVVSGVVGLPLLIGLREVSSGFGSIAMGTVGGFNMGEISGRKMLERVLGTYSPVPTSKDRVDSDRRML